MVRRNNKSRRNQSQNKRQNKRNTRKQNGGIKRAKAMLYVEIDKNINAANIQQKIDSMGEQQPGDLYYLVRLRDE